MKNKNLLTEMIKRQLNEETDIKKYYKTGFNKLVFALEDLQLAIKGPNVPVKAKDAIYRLIQAQSLLRNALDDNFEGWNSK